MQLTLDLPQEQEIPQVLYILQKRISRLAAMWRGAISHDENRAKEIEKEYTSILKSMIALGFNEALDVDSELPDELLPVEYLNIFAN